MIANAILYIQTKDQSLLFQIYSPNDPGNLSFGLTNTRQNLDEACILAFSIFDKFTCRSFSSSVTSRRSEIYRNRSSCRCSTEHLMLPSIKPLVTMRVLICPKLEHLPDSTAVKCQTVSVWSLSPDKVAPRKKNECVFRTDPKMKITFATAVGIVAA